MKVAVPSPKIAFSGPSLRSFGTNKQTKRVFGLGSQHFLIIHLYQYKVNISHFEGGYQNTGILRNKTIQDKFMYTPKIDKAQIMSK